MGCMRSVDGGGIDMGIRLDTLVGRVTSSGEESSSMEPNSASSFSSSSSLITGADWPSC